MEKKKNPMMMMTMMPCYISILPTHILVNHIFCKLPISDILQCKNVCKTWRNLLLNPDSTKLIRLSRQPACLLLCQQKNNTNLLHWLESHNGFYSFASAATFSPKKYSPDADVEVVNSCNGLICVSEGKKHNIHNAMHILNPVTGEYVTLPTQCELGWGSFSFLWAIGFCFKSNLFKAIRILYPLRDDDNESVNMELEGKVEVYTLGTGVWRSVGPAPPVIYVWEYGPSFVNGCLHWFAPGMLTDLSVFDIETEKFGFLPLPSNYKDVDFDGDPDDYYCGFGPVNVGAFRDSLCFSYFDTGGVCQNFVIWLMQEYGVENSWKKMFVIRSPLTELEVEYPPLVFGNWDILVYSKQMKRTILYNPEKKSCKGLTHLVGSVKATVHNPSFASLKDIVGEHGPKVLNIKSSH